MGLTHTAMVRRALRADTAPTARSSFPGASPGPPAHSTRPGNPSGLLAILCSLDATAL